MARLTPIAAEVLKIAHHGSAYSSSASFLSAVGAKDNVIEVGHNSYGHPNADTLSRLAQSGAQTWRTDQNGNVVVASDGLTYTITSSDSQPTPPIYRLSLPVISYMTEMR